MEQKRLGIFGGTFDPIHLGHLRAALEVKEAFGLEKVFFVPSFRAPHKKTGGVAESAHRLAMTELAVKGAPGFLACDFEVARPVPSYTIETLTHFSRAYPDWERFFLVGLDAFLEISTWRRYEELFSLARFVVMSRPWPGDPGRNEMEAYAEKVLAPALEKAGRPGMKMEFFGVTPMGISSSFIRKAVGAGRSIGFLVPRAVEDYIRTRELYR